MAEQSRFELRGFVTQLNDLLKALPEEVTPGDTPRGSLNRLRADIRRAIGQLTRLVAELDPVKQPSAVFDPADPKVMGELIARTLLIQPRLPLADLQPFYGSGVYALYYQGDFPAYRRISGQDWPIYVGKADPADSKARSVEEQGARLARRLNDHVRSITPVSNLKLQDFTCRFLVVKSAWQGTAELYLIDRFKPVWNNEVKVCFGFGKHGDSAGTRRNTRSPWDTLHPGRKWAWKKGNVDNPKSADEIATAVKEHLAATFDETGER